jgi:hypothetical protein
MFKNTVAHGQNQEKAQVESCVVKSKTDRCSQLGPLVYWLFYFVLSFPNSFLLLSNWAGKNRGLS